jgi:hypothetical protein
MRSWQIILTQAVFLTGCQPWWGQQMAPAAPPMGMPYPATATPQPVFVQGVQPIAQPGPVMVVPVESSPMMTYPQPSVLPGPIVAPQSTVMPQGVVPPGTVLGPPRAVPVPPGSVLDPSAVALPGVAPNPDVNAAALGPNPVAVRVTNEDVAWDQIADVVSGYFTISREQRARRSGEVWTEGRIDTVPLDGATWLQPFRKDSVGTFNRWESTFQTIRRRATVRVIPDAAGYLVEVIVEKELEDLPSPEKATSGAATFLDDDALPSQQVEAVSRTASSPRWLMLGRDPLLEQRMLADIQARLGTVAR